METFQQQFENNLVWQRFKARFPPILTYEEFNQARYDGKFHALVCAIIQIDEYKNFNRAWLWGNYSLGNDWDIEKANTASCYLPNGAKDGDFLFLAAKLTQGRKGETDLKYIWHHIVPYETLGQ